MYQFWGKIMDEQNKKEFAESAQMNASNEGASFADLLAMQDSGPVRYEPGQKVSATVVRIGKSWIFIDLGGKSEGCLDKGEFADKEGGITLVEGDQIQAYFLSAQHDEMLFTTRMSGIAAQAHLGDAFENGIPLEGFVVKEVKGGYEVKVAGNVRAFCPFSQTGLRREQSDEDFLETHQSFKIIEYGENGRNIIVSRRALIEEEQRQKKEALRDTLEIDMTVTGTVTAIRDFGAFVDIGGLEGLLPISEIGWGRVEDIRSTLHEGQQVEVAIKKLDWEADRFSFSLKDTLPDPWERVSELFSVGSITTGKVARLTEFGAFVTLTEGIDGLLHISNMGQGKRINHPRELFEVGQAVEVKIEGIDLEKRRVSLVIEKAVTGAEKDQEAKEQPENDYRDYSQKAAQSTAKSMGTFGDLLKAGMGKKSGK